MSGSNKKYEKKSLDLTRKNIGIAMAISNLIEDRAHALLNADVLIWCFCQKTDEKRFEKINHSVVKDSFHQVLSSRARPQVGAKFGKKKCTGSDTDKRP